MLHLNSIDHKTFLKEYWQKKPLVIRNALPDFVNSISGEELAGLALEEEIESRIVYETPNQTPQWHLKRGPFNEKEFTTLPETHWTLLVQGVDRLIPEVYQLLDHFNFIPSWRVDDVMISYAAQQGSVGPHYDLYDVFLYQAQGRRKWSLTTQKCNPQNAVEGLELRIMDEFLIEQEFILEEGDMLYLPPHVGHYGVSLSDECLTYSFGYRSYQGQEVLESLCDYAAEEQCFKALYRDPDWSQLTNTGEVPENAWKQAQQLLAQLISDPALMQDWFASFATRLDRQAESQISYPLDEDERIPLEKWLKLIPNYEGFERDPCCRFAYTKSSDQGSLQLYINGCEWETNATSEFIKFIANQRVIHHSMIESHLNHIDNQKLLYDLWVLQWLQFIEE